MQRSPAAAPDASARAEMGSAFLVGLGIIGARMLILIDIDKLMSGPEMGLSDIRPA